MPNKLNKYLIDLFGDFRKKITSAVLLYLLSNAGILWLKNALQVPIPLWLAILVSLSILFVCAILFLIYSYKNTPKIKKELVEAGRFLWETTFENNNVLRVAKVPYCKIHELRLVKFQDTYQCMETNCKTSIEDRLLHRVYEIALTYIERDIRKMC